MLQHSQHQTPVSSLKGCSSFPGTDDKCHHQKLMVGLSLRGLFPPKGFHNSISPKTGVALGAPSFSASQPGAPAHLSGVPSQRGRRESGAGTGEIPHEEQEPHLGLACMHSYGWGTCSCFSPESSVPAVSPLLLLFFEVGELRAWITSLININIAKHK